MKRKQLVVRWTIPGCTATTAFVGIGIAPLGTPNYLPVVAEHQIVQTTREAPIDSVVRDPNLRMGTLDNGMRYYVQTNPIPAQRAELRVVVDAGSVQEDDDQRGFAHFLEHSAFNGTRRYPGNTLIDEFESWGMSFGAHLNASTSFRETIYRLTVPTDDSTILRRAMQVLEDWAGGGILLDSASVADERGVVLQEAQSRQNSATASLLHVHKVLRGSKSRYPDRLPIGDASLISQATPAPLKRYYTDWYRPERMTVIVVGDIDANETERSVRELFGRIKPASTLARDGDDVVEIPAAPVFDLYRDRNVAGVPQIAAMWRIPPRSTNTTQAIRDIVKERLLFGYLDDRLKLLRRQRLRPYAQAEIARAEVARDFTVYGVRVYARADSLLHGFRVALSELERVARQGIPFREFERRKVRLLRELAYAAENGRVTSSSDKVQQLVAHALRGDVVLASARQYDSIARTIIPTMTPDSIAQFARFWYMDQHRYVLIRVREDEPTWSPDTSDVARVLQEIRSASPEVLGMAETTDYGDPGKETSVDSSLKSARAEGETNTRHSPQSSVTAAATSMTETTIPGSGIVQWVLPNGVRVLYRRVPDDPQRMLVQAYSVRGTATLPDSLFHGSGRLMAELIDAGANSRITELQDADTMGTIPSDAIVQTAYNFADANLSITGDVQHREFLFQEFAQLLMSPPIDSSSIAAWNKQGRPFNAPSPNDVLLRMDAPGHPRISPLTELHRAQVKLPHARAAFGNTFGYAGDMTILVFGPLPASQIRSLVERYLSQLSPVSGHGPSGPLVNFTFRHVKGMNAMRFTVGVIRMEFIDTLPKDPAEYLRERHRTELIAWLVQRRLRTVIREALGGTYSVFGRAYAVDTPDPRWGLQFQFSTDKARTSEMRDSAASIFEQIRTHGFSASEIQLAETVQRRALETRMQSVSEWAGMVQKFLLHGLPLDRVGSLEAPQSPEEMREKVRWYLRRE